VLDRNLFEIEPQCNIHKIKFDFTLNRLALQTAKSMVEIAVKTMPAFAPIADTCDLAALSRKRTLDQ